MSRAKSNGNASANDSSANLGFEAKLWLAADKVRNNMDASEYKHVCLGLIFLKYISDAFEEKREQLLFGFSDPKTEWFIMPHTYTEDKLVEQPDIGLFAELGWTTVFVIQSFWRTRDLLLPRLLSGQIHL